MVLVLDLLQSMLRSDSVAVRYTFPVKIILYWLLIDFRCREREAPPKRLRVSQRSTLACSNKHFNYFESSFSLQFFTAFRFYSISTQCKLLSADQSFLLPCTYHKSHIGTFHNSILLLTPTFTCIPCSLLFLLQRYIVRSFLHFKESHALLYCTQLKCDFHCLVELLLVRCRKQSVDDMQWVFQFLMLFIHHQALPFCLSIGQAAGWVEVQIKKIWNEKDKKEI